MSISSISTNVLPSALPGFQTASGGEGTPSHEANESAAERISEKTASASTTPAAGAGKGQNVDTAA